ncbi:MAG: phosphoenolpyruvate synthase [Deinococcales bacterium]
METIVPFQNVGLDDIARVGGKNASIGEMIGNLRQAGVRVPEGFATTAEAFATHVETTGLKQRIASLLEDVDENDVGRLAERGRAVRALVLETPLPEALASDVREAYRAMGSPGSPATVAVRSSATAEDLAEASFAGQQETFLNVRGEEGVLEHVRKVYASLFTDRAIAYRLHHGFVHTDVAISVGIQRMVRSDLGASGVAFTLDTESGFDGVVFVTAAYGLGELLVQGAVNPDEFYLSKDGLRADRPAVLMRRLGSKAEKMVYGTGDTLVETVPVPEEERHRFSLQDDDLTDLGRQALAIEAHYGRPMDIEWAKDGEDGRIYVLQARPETVRSRSGRVLERFRLREHGEVLVRGRAVGSRIAAGTVRVIESADEMERVEKGDVLVTDMTDPNWELVMKRAAAIVTDRGGRTCHAAIIARELNIPAVVGTGDATRLLESGADVTVSCAEGDEGLVYRGHPRFDVERVELDRMPPLPVDLMMNVASPDRAFAFAKLPNKGVGLARLEFIINNDIGVHPRALLAYPDVPPKVREGIERRSAGYGSPARFFEEKIKEGVATIAAAFAPHPVIVRMTDFKSNEYAHLLGGEAFEPHEENPMIGFRGASRYRAESFADAFAAECRALVRVRQEMGLTNVKVMIPFVRTEGELVDVLGRMADHGLRRGEHGLQIIMMCEVPSNAIRPEAFLQHVDGFSIGSNDLTQFTLALDRDSGLVAELFNERDPAVQALMANAIAACKAAGKYVGICGQGPSDHPDLARWLLEQGIDSISLNPDTVLETWLYLAGEDAGEQAG